MRIWLPVRIQLQVLRRDVEIALGRFLYHATRKIDWPCLITVPCAVCDGGMRLYTSTWQSCRCEEGSVYLRIGRIESLLDEYLPRCARFRWNDRERAWDGYGGWENYQNGWNQ